MITVTRSTLPPKEEYFQQIASIWDSHWLTNMGVKHQQLQRELESFLCVPHMTLFANGHLALESAIRALGLTGEVITTPFTFASTTHAIVRCGLTPVFCDINPADYTMDVTKLEALITDRTSAILPVHVYGNPCDVEEIQRIATRHGLKVLYDAAHSFGVTVNGKGIANFGDASMFSFHATKVFNTIEGGGVAYHDDALIKALDLEKNFGIADPETISLVGGNAKMSEFQAAMGLCNLPRVQHEIEKRRVVVERYRERLSGISGIRLTADPVGVSSNYAYLPALFDGFVRTRDEVYEDLLANDILARKYFYPVTNAFACYAGRFDPSLTPVAEYMSQRVLTLPLYGDLEIADVDRICNVIIKGGSAV